MPRKPSCRPRTANSLSPLRFSRSSHSPVSAWMPASRQAGALGCEGTASPGPRASTRSRPLARCRRAPPSARSSRRPAATPRRSRGQFWIALTVSTGTMYSSPVTPLRDSKWSSSASYWSTSVACSIFGAKTPSRPGHDHGLQVGSGEPGRERVDPDEQAHVGVRLAHAGDRRRRPSRGQRPSPPRNRVLEVEHDGVRAGSRSPCRPRRPVRRGRRGRMRYGLHRRLRLSSCGQTEDVLGSRSSAPSPG